MVIIRIFEFLDYIYDPYIAIALLIICVVLFIGFAIMLIISGGEGMGGIGTNERL